MTIDSTDNQQLDSQLSKPSTTRKMLTDANFQAINEILEEITQELGYPITYKMFINYLVTDENLQRTKQVIIKKLTTTT